MHINGNRALMAELDLRVKVHMWLPHYHILEKSIEIKETSLIFVTFTITFVENVADLVNH